MEEKDSSVGKPEGEESGQPKLRKFTPEKLKEILEEHKKWVVSQEKEGTKANLQKANLQEANLQGAELGEANLQGANLFGANLQEADLGKANLQEAHLGGANLERADLGRSDFRVAILQDADLTSAKGLQGGQLAGANVSGARLPRDIAKFEEGLKVVEEASRNARKLFFAMLSACAYALLTIATTTDVLLLTNSRSSPLPIIRTEIPIVWFYFAAPLVLLCLYFYFHLYMQRLWEGLAKLPAVFPDGRSLDEKAYPWLLTGLVRAHALHLRKERPPLSHLQEWISIFLAWMFMPGTLICFWLRYIPRQDWFGTALHIGLLVGAVWAGVLFYRLAVGTLRWDEIELSLWKKPFKEVTTYKRGVLAAKLGLILLLLSLGTINGVPSGKFLLNNRRTWVPYVFERFGFSPFANFRDKDVSTKPPNWSGKAEEILLVKGAPLRGRNLRYAKAKGAFLVNAQLLEANLYGASLPWANLRGADLWRANLRRADLGWTNLQGAKFTSANLYGASLEWANLQETDLNGANLQGANLIGAKGLKIGELRSAVNWAFALYNKATVRDLELPSDHNERLRKKNLKEYKLLKANLRNADLREANLQEADLWGAKLQGADLREAKLQGADLRKADLQGANLGKANLEGAKLVAADLQGADLTKAKNLTPEQLSKVKTLYKAKLDKELKTSLEGKHKHLFDKPKED